MTQLDIFDERPHCFDIHKYETTGFSSVEDYSISTLASVKQLDSFKEPPEIFPTMFAKPSVHDETSGHLQRVCDRHDRHFKPKHDVSPTLTERLLSLNLTRAPTQHCA